ncbi:MAG: hypothetical protein RLZZ502_1850 [Pseudomonadota bacterium]|jgi:uncharacterized DUF497 family protein
MEISFDTQKDLSNLNKHGVPLSAAAAFEWDTAIMWPDLRKAYGEARMIAIGYIGNRLHVLAFVDRDEPPQEVRRIISLRKANLREENHYAQT